MNKKSFLRYLSISAGFLVLGYFLLVVGLTMFNHYMAEGVLQAPTLGGKVLVALSDNPSIRKLLLENCSPARNSSKAGVKSTNSRLVAETPSGTKVRFESENYSVENGLRSAIILEGRLKGQQVWVCEGQYALLHAWW